MRVVFFGSGSFAVPAMRSLTAAGHDVAVVVSQPPRPAGRGKQLMPTPVAEAAARYGFELLTTDNVNTPEFIDRIAALKADLGVVIDFGQKLKAPLCSVFPSECLNVHGSLLPKYRGAAPVAHAILAGESGTGVSVFRLTDRMDAGPVLVRRETLIGPFENQQELHDRLAGIGCDALRAALGLHAGVALPPGEPQDESQASQAPKLTKADGLIRFDRSAELIARQCRAFFPWPGARCRYVGADRSEEVTLLAVTPAPTPSEYPPGTLTPILTVATGSGTIEIHMLQPAGRKPMGWQDFVNGRRARPGDRFEGLGA